MPEAKNRVRKVSSLAVYFGTSFLLHFMWEMLQWPLFRTPPLTFVEHLQTCLFATATGDMAFMLILYLTGAVIHRDGMWIRSTASYRHPATWAVTALVGALLAVCFELWAVHIVHRWEYGRMPLVPVLQVGWFPVLQMVIVPLLTLLATWRLARRTR